MHAVTDQLEHDLPREDGLDSTPQVRTLLLTDLCDSTLLVEKLGDGLAAELFREHDRLVLGLQQRWRGRLIDRSDGLLLLFERAIDGLGFALDYARELRAIGERRSVARFGIDLRARSGLHVGEVLMWRNSDAAVSFGAKPLEVEGLAKPMAGRLMTLARPGQILLSATAEPLAHRAARELGERGAQLVWKSWGRWRFKGVPQPQEVYEVGEPDIAPLRAPQQIRAKAWRDIPVWRRPAALAAELLLVAGLATGGWFLTRPQPAIAFAERDWVVVADLRNLTGDTLLDESLEQAFRISLEQSRYVNVLSDLKVRETLERMRRSPDTTLDRTIASEIALRDGARAVILPTVAEVGGRVRVSAEVIDPHTQTTVYAESADGSGAPSTLRSIDKVTTALREKLGEAVESIQRNSISLPNVTTSNLDALKAYAIGRDYAAKGDATQALAYYRRAATLDPQFALAFAAAGGVQFHVLGDIPAAQRDFQHALALRARLSPRESLKLDLAVARFGPPGIAMQRAKELLELYPDELDARLTAGQIALWELNDPATALVHAKAASIPQYVRSASARYLKGIALLALGAADKALAEFDRSRKEGFKGAGYSIAYVHAAQRDWPRADAALAAIPKAGVPADASLADEAAILALDRGDRRAAVDFARNAEQAALESEPLVLGTWVRVRRLLVDVLAGFESRDALRARLAAMMDDVEAKRDAIEAHAPSLYASLLQSLGYAAARLDAPALLGRAMRGLSDEELEDYPVAVQLRQILVAEQRRLAGDPGAAAKALDALASHRDALALVHAARMHAAAAAGQYEVVSDEAQWLATHRERAYVERPGGDLLTVVPVYDSTFGLLMHAEAAMRTGHASEARKQAEAFAAAWAPDTLPPALRKRLDALRGAAVSPP